MICSSSDILGIDGGRHLILSLIGIDHQPLCIYCTYCLLYSSLLFGSWLAYWTVTFDCTQVFVTNSSQKSIILRCYLTVAASHFHADPTVAVAYHWVFIQQLLLATPTVMVVYQWLLLFITIGQGLDGWQISSSTSTDWLYITKIGWLQLVVYSYCWLSPNEQATAVTINLITIDYDCYFHYLLLLVSIGAQNLSF